MNALVKDFEYQENKIETLEVTADIKAQNNWQTELVLQAENLLVASQEVAKTDLTIIGDAENHALNAEIEAREWSSVQQLKGGIEDLSNLVWNGEWIQSEFRFQNYNLTKQQSTSIQFNQASSTAMIESHCWIEQMTSGKFCSDELEWKDENIDINAKLEANIAAVLIENWPDLFLAESDLLLNTSINGNYSLAGGADLLIANLITGNIVTSRHNVEVTAIVANVDIQNDEINTTLYAGTENTGRLGVSSKIELEGEEYSHQGNLALSNLELSTLRRFLPGVSSLTGNVNANLQYKGELTQPDIFGDIKVENGALFLDAYTYPLTEFNQTH